MSVDRIFHLTTASELRAGVDADRYAPRDLDAVGFVHCAATPESVLAVAGDYFADADEPVFVLEIEVDRLAARLVFEAPAPIAGGGTQHLEGAVLFPHVYGPVNRDAIVGAARLDGAAGFAWPARMRSLDELLADESP